MNTRNDHPETGLLDQLRAGLLADDPGRRDELRAHLQGCEQCRQRYDLSGTLQPGVLGIEAPDEKLNQARRQALQAPAKSRLQHLVPAAAVAAVALVAVLLVTPLQDSGEPESLVADNQNRDVPELYEELDFYLWLADHKRSEDSTT